jgi:flagellar hook-length control protein FliK
MSSVESTLPQGRKSAAEIAAASVMGASGKKSSESTKAVGNRTPAFGIAAPVKHDSTPAPNVKMPAAPSDPSAQTASDPRSITLPDNPISNASAKEIAESHMATKAASQAKALDPTLVAESRSAAERSSASDLAKVKDHSSAGVRDRIGKDRGKDTRSGSTDSGKLAPTQAGRVVVGTTNFGGNSSKDSGMGSPHNLAAQVKPGLAKQSGGISSVPTSIAEMDGPDEAVPLTTSSPISAKFVQGMSGSEFRVGMQSQEFGSIDIRTSVARHMFSAQISVEHSDVAKSLATELPSLYSKLADQHVPVANIVIQGQSLGSSSGFAQDAQQQQGWRPQQSHGGVSLNTDTILPVAAEALDSQGRLDIRI